MPDPYRGVFHMRRLAIQAVYAGVILSSLGGGGFSSVGAGSLSGIDTGETPQYPLPEASQVVFVQGTSLSPIAEHYAPERIIQKIRVVVTGYSSDPKQTDDTPYITAAGTLVRDGIVAANFLPMGTKIKLPDLYGDRVFVVEDRMHPRKHYQVDIWFPSYWEALHFGAKRTYIEVLEG